MDNSKTIPVRRIPILTQAELETIREPGDITKIVQARPDREYQLVQGQAPDSSEREPRTHLTARTLPVLWVAGASFAFGISIANILLDVTGQAIAFGAICAITLLGTLHGALRK